MVARPKSEGASPPTVPDFLAPIVGRELDVATIVEMLADERLLVLSGSGGIGKTRLAAELVASMTDRFGANSWWVDLGPVGKADDIGSATSSALGMFESDERVLPEHVARRLQHTPSLLVFDNCDRVATAVAHWIEALLALCPRLCIVATSRVLVPVEGAVFWTVLPLAVPTAEVADPEEIRQYEAVRAFADRATRANSVLRIDGDRWRVIAEICRKLDGVPLAIELAAAHCRRLPLEEVDRLLDSRFRLLRHSGRARLPHHETMLESVEWSTRLLSEQERCVLQQLCVFGGPFRLDAAEAVVSSVAGLDRWEVIDTLGRLVESSLVQIEDHTSSQGRPIPLYRLHETIREYGRERVSGGEFDLLQEAHVDWWITTLEDVDARQPTWTVIDLLRFHGSDIRALLGRLDDDPRRFRLLALVAYGFGWAGQIEMQLPFIDRWLVPGPPEGLETEWAIACGACGDPIFGFDRRELTRRAEEILDLLVVAGDGRALMAGNNFSIFATDRQKRFEQTLELCESTGANLLLRTYGLGVLVVLSEADPTAVARWEPTLRSIGLPDDAANRTNEFLYRSPLRSDNPAEIVAFDREALRALGPVPSPGDEYFSFDRLFMRAVSVWPALRRDDRDLIDEIVGALTAHASVDAWRRMATATRALRALMDGVPLEQPDAAPTLRFAAMSGISAQYALARLVLATGDRATALRSMPATPLLGASTVSTPLIGAVLALHGDRITEAGQLLSAAIDAEREYPWEDLHADMIELAAVMAHRSGHASRASAFAAVAASKRAALQITYRYADQAAWLDGIDPATEDPRGLLTALDVFEMFQRGRGSNRSAKLGWSSLTPTERRVVELVSSGRSNPEIAQALIIGRSTVKTHISRAFVKLDVTNRTELAAAFHREMTSVAVANMAP